MTTMEARPVAASGPTAFLRRWPALALAAAGLLFLGLGLPFESGTETQMVPGSPFCTPNWDGPIDCTYIVPSDVIVVDAVTLGHASTARIFLVGAIVLIAYAVARRSQDALRASVAVIVLGVIVTGPRGTSGQAAALLAVVCIVALLRQQGAPVLRSGLGTHSP